MAASTTAEAETGKLLVAVAKRLKAYSAGDRIVAQFLAAASISGRAGLLASALRNHQKLSPARFQALCSDEGFNKNDVKFTIGPWLMREGLAEIKFNEKDITSIRSSILAYDGILRAIMHLFESLDPTQEERGCLLALSIVSELPTPESAVLQALSGVLREEVAKRALQIATGHGIVERWTGKGLREPILYSPRVWRKAIAKASKPLSVLTPDQRAAVTFLVERVRVYQGYPEEQLRLQAVRDGVEQMLDLAIGVGLIGRTWIRAGDGADRAFLTTPHFYVDMAAEHGEDMCDRVKLFLDSIRNGQHYGFPGTGRIFDADRLLRKLLNVGEIGPCTAIGRDYTMVERAGIVLVKRSSLKPGQYVMSAVQDDTIRQVHEIVTRGQVVGDSPPMDESQLGPDGRFVSMEEGRLAEAPGQVAEAERAIILALREG